MKTIATLLVTLAITGCSTMAEPYGAQARSAERQAKSDQCWGYGQDNTLVYMTTLVAKPFVCIANDLTRGQAQITNNTGFDTATVITPVGTYRRISSPGLVTVTRIAY